MPAWEAREIYGAAVSDARKLVIASDLLACRSGSRKISRGRDGIIKFSGNDKKEEGRRLSTWNFFKVFGLNVISLFKDNNFVLWRYLFGIVAVNDCGLTLHDP